MIIHTWNLNQTCQTSVSVSLKKGADGAVLATLYKDGGEIPIQHVKGVPEDLSGLGSTTARVKQVGESFRLKVIPLERREASGVSTLHLATHYIRQAVKHAAKAKNQPIVAFIGNTGAGKSTLINHILGVGDMVQGTARVYVRARNAWQNKIDRIMPGDPLMEKTEIGHTSTTSHTLFSKVYSGNELVVADCGGFLDTRSGAEALAVPLSIAYTLRNAQTVKLAVCVTYASLQDDKCQNFGKIVETIGKQLAAEGRREDVLSQVELIITKAPPRYTAQDAVAFIQEVIDELPNNDPYMNYYKQIARDQGKHVHVYHPLDEGHSANAIRTALSQPGGVKDPSTAFNPPYSRDSLDILVTETGRIVSVVAQLDQRYSALDKKLERLTTRKGDLVRRRDELNRSIAQNEFLSEAVINRLQEEIRVARASILENEETIKKINSPLGEKHLPFQLQDIQRRVNEAFSIASLKQLLKDLETIQDQEARDPIFDEGSHTDAQNELFVRETKVYRVADHTRWGMAFVALTGVIAAEAALDAMLGMKDKKVEELKPKEQKRTFSHTGLPATRIVLDPPRENPCWSQESRSNLGEGQPSSYTITYNSQGRVDADVKLYTTVRYTAEFRDVVRAVNEKIERKQEEIFDLRIKNAELLNDIGTKEREVKAAADSQALKVHRDELENDLTKIDQKESAVRGQQEALLQEVRSLGSDFELVRNFIELCNDPQLQNQPYVQAFQAIDRRFSNLIGAP